MTAENGTALSIASTKIIIIVVPFDSSAPPVPRTSDEVSVSIPSEISASCSDNKLSKVFYKEALY